MTYSYWFQSQQILILKAIGFMWSLIFKCTVYHFLEHGHNASVAFVWPNVIINALLFL